MEITDRMPAPKCKRRYLEYKQSSETIASINRRRESLRSSVTNFKRCCNGALLGLLVLCLAAKASDDPAVDQRPAITVDEIALELSNPVTALRSLANHIKYRTFQGYFPGSDDQSSLGYVLTPSWPFKLSNGRNILLRGSIPINFAPPTWTNRSWGDFAEFRIRQSVLIDPELGEFIIGHGHMDDISIDIAYGGVSDNGFISMFGLATVLSTSDDGSAARQQYLLGPEIALGQVTSWGLFGARVKHLTHIGAQTHQWDTNETTAQLFFAYALGNGWQIESNPIILYDWEAVSGNEWTVPIGVGVSKTIMLGRIPTKLAFDIQNYVVSPDRFGPKWQATFSITPVISTKLMR